MSRCVPGLTLNGPQWPYLVVSTDYTLVFKACWVGESVGMWAAKAVQPLTRSLEKPPEQGCSGHVMLYEAVLREEGVLFKNLSRGLWAQICVQRFSGHLRFVRHQIDNFLSLSFVTCKMGMNVFLFCRGLWQLSEVSVQRFVNKRFLYKADMGVLVQEIRAAIITTLHSIM